MLIRPVEVARFSPYFENPEAYGITNIRPADVYSNIFPESANLDNLAWLFYADFTSESKDNALLKGRIKKVVSSWMDKWNNGYNNIPYLRVTASGNGKYLLEDSRFDCIFREQISLEQAKVALFGINDDINLECIAWGCERKVLYQLNGQYMPLATAHPRVYKELCQ
jgi:hypothetical protein